MVEWRVNQAFQGPFRSRRQGVSSWMTRAEMVLETLVHSPLNHVTPLLARKYFIKVSRRTSFRLCNTKSCVLFMCVVCLPPWYMTKWLRCTDVGGFHADIVLRHIYIWGPLGQCFSTAGPRPGTGPWQQLFRTAIGSPGICHFSFLSSFHE